MFLLPALRVQAQTPDATAPQPTPEQVQRMQRTLEDWPNLARYRDDDAKLPPAGADEQRVVFIGDSLTDNWGRVAGRFFPGKPYVNRGIGGQTTPQMVLRFPQDVLQLHPAAVVILGGTNDLAGNTGPETLEEIESNLRIMVTLAQAAHIRVILASVLPASSFPWRPAVQPVVPIRQLNRWIERYAAETHSVFLNYFPALVDGRNGMRPELALDRLVHPNDAGYSLMQPLAEAAIAKALAQPRP